MAIINNRLFIKNTKEINNEKLDEYLKLRKNWNQYDSDPFNKLLIKKVRNIINNLIYQPFILPTARDSIQLEYECVDRDKGKRYYLEFEVFINKIDYFINMNEPLFNSTVGRIDNELDEKEQIKEINRIIDKFYKEIDLMEGFVIKGND